VTEPEPTREREPEVRRWTAPGDPPKRPYRDSVVFYTVLAGLIVLVTWLTGGDVGRGIGVAAAFFVVATAWSWWRWRQRLGERRKRIW
jgi:Flp pilus assembly protein TadB